VNHATETIATLDTSFAPFCRRGERWACRLRRSEVCSARIALGPNSGEFIAPCRSDRPDGLSTFEAVM